MKRGVLILLAVSLLLAGCGGDDPTGVPDHPEGQVVGIWNWESTLDPWTGVVTTPQDVGYTETLYFYPDLTCERYQDATLVAQSSWFATIEGNQTVVQVGATTEYRLTGDLLIDDQTPVDGPRVTYRWAGFLAE